ncbi:MAG: hypothetical protein J0M12_15740 [Deltaproteobacteria bacterium]|nr:hypothetical protein [Deltaproteobacteria bacterium]
MSDPIVEHVRNSTQTEHDSDVAKMSDKQLREELVVLRNAVRLHRDEKGHDRCWVDDARLYGALPEKIGAVSQLPRWPEFQTNCRRFWESRQCPTTNTNSCSSEEKT